MFTTHENVDAMISILVDIAENNIPIVGAEWLFLGHLIIIEAYRRESRYLVFTSKSLISFENLNPEKFCKNQHFVHNIIKRHENLVTEDARIDNFLVRLLNHITWKKVSVNDHPMTIAGGSSVIIYKEHERGTPIPTEELITPAAAALFVTKSKYEIQSCPALVPVIKPDLNKANPKIGVSLVSFSPDSRYMFTKNDNMPNCLWLWDVQHLSLAVILIQASVIKCVEWDPRQSRLALCTATNKLYMWSPSGCLAVDVPAEASFQVHSLRWHPDGDAILLLSKDQMCVCFLASTSTQEAMASSKPSGQSITP